MYGIAFSLCTVFSTYGMEPGDGEIESPVIFQATSWNGLYQAFVYGKNEKRWVKVLEDESMTQNVPIITISPILDVFFSENKLVVVYEFYDHTRQIVIQIGKDHPSNYRCIESWSSIEHGGAPEAK